MSKQGFTLIELLIVITMITLLAAVLLTNVLTTRQKANLTGAQAYVRNVATQLEATRDPLTGTLNPSITTCMSNFGIKPQSITGCSITYTNNINDFIVTSTLSNAEKNTITYQSANGAFSLQ